MPRTKRESIEIDEEMEIQKIESNQQESHSAYLEKSNTRFHFTLYDLIFHLLMIIIIFSFAILIIDLFFPTYTMSIIFIIFLSALATSLIIVLVQVLRQLYRRLRKGKFPKGSLAEAREKMTQNYFKRKEKVKKRKGK